MPSSIFFNGRLISVPGSYSEVDASGLESVGLGATGVIGVLGTAEGGRPASTITEVGDFIRLTKPEQRTFFKSGDLREVADMLFAPSKDPDILGGAQQVVAMKVNPATQSTAQFDNAQGPALELTSLDYGAFTGQVNVAIGPGTTKGKTLAIVFEDVTEAVDDLGGDTMLTLQYTKPTNGWDTMTAQVLAGGIVQANATRAVAGLDSDMGVTLAAPGAIQVVSSAAGDVGQIITVYGLDGSAAPVRERLVLNGTVAVVGTQIFAAAGVLGAIIDGTTAGTVSVDPSGGGADVFTIAAGTNPVKGAVRGVAMYGASTMSLSASGATTKRLIVAGHNAGGTFILEKFTLAGAGVVAGAAVWSDITAIILGEVEAARTVTVTGKAGKTDPLVQKTMQKVYDYYQARYVPIVGGFVATLVTAQTQLAPSNLDVSVSASSCLGPASVSFLADLYALVSWINQNSVLIGATRLAIAGGAPNNTTTPVFLAGGSEGTTLFSHWQNALNLLKRARVNTVVVLTGDPAVHAALDAHCAYMCGVGRSERDGVVGVLNAGLTDVPTKAEYKSAVVALNSRHVRAVGQAIERFNSLGERQEYMPQFHAALVAGAQAGSPVGTPLTHKYLNALSLRQHSSWNPTDDAEEMVQAGAMIAENVEGVGRRWVRNITTHLSTNNLAFIEGSVNAAVNFAAFNFRTNMEYAVGRRGFSGTVNAAKSIAINTLGLLVSSNVLVATRSLNIELIVDVLEVSVEMAPVLPVNFVRNTIHLVTIRQTAA